MRPAALALLAAACGANPRIHPRAAEEVRRGYEQLDRGEVERAEVAFAHALEFNEDIAEAWNGAGLAAHRRGDRRLAAERFRRAVASRADFAEGHVNLGVLAMEAGDHRAAEGHLRKALAVNPDLAVARLDLARALLHRGRAEPAARAGHWGRARAEYLHLLETEPGHASAWQELGYMDYEDARFGRAAAEYRRAADARPSPEALHGLCISLVRLGRCAEAAGACRRCLGLDPESAPCRKSLAGAERCDG